MKSGKNVRSLSRIIVVNVFFVLIASIIGSTNRFNGFRDLKKISWKAWLKTFSKHTGAHQQAGTSEGP
jgi:hypothetical protein